MVENFSEDIIENDFKHFGTIKSVEIIDNGKFEANVTFDENRSATMAFLFTYYRNEHINRTIRKKWFVEPVQTFDEPPRKRSKMDKNLQEVGKESPSPPIFNLNEDCFEYLFKFLDLDSMANMTTVCKTFNRMLVDKNGLGNRHFRRFEALKIDTSKMTFQKARQLLQLIGQYIQRLHFDSLWRREENKYFDEITKYCKENICELVLKVRQFPLKDDFNSIFPNLLTLEFDTNFDVGNVDLPMICPNLVKCSTYCDDLRTDYDNFKHWPSLQIVHLLAEGPIIIPLSRRIVNNPQLKELKFDCDDRYQIHIIAKNLPNLEKLVIPFDKTSSEIIDSLMLLRQLRHLREITFHVTMAFDEMLERMVDFKNLRLLELYHDNEGPLHDEVPLNDEQNLINFVERAPLLEHFFLDQTYASLSTVIKVIKSGTQLKTLGLCCEENINGNAFSKIINIRKSFKNNPLVLISKDAALYESFLEAEDKKYLRFKEPENYNFYW